MDASVAASAPKQEIRLEDYKAPGFNISGLDLVFRLYDEYAEVQATSIVVRCPGSSVDVVLDGGPYMELKAVRVDGSPLAEGMFRRSENTLTLIDTPQEFTLEVVTWVRPKENTRLEGLYFSGGNFCTQCEAEGFRHITYFPDRPDVLTTYKVRIEADRSSCPVLLSNGNPGESGTLDSGRHFAEWIDPHPKPSYLFALVAGDLGLVSDEFVTLSGRSVTLNIYAAQKDLGKCDYAMQSLKRSMKWDEDVFGLEYDLDIYNIVAVSDFNMGAMENKGLNIFNTKYVLASPETATDADFDHVEGVIGHEYFHNWTGNRVTCRDWFQLSLKEGLTVFRDQEFSSDMTSRSVKRLDDVRVLRMLQFPEDAGPLAHPIRPEKYVEINNFYTATVYNKGAEVIRMMHRLIGAEAFRAGMDLYFDRFDGQAVTCEDFVAAMEDASSKNLNQFRRWYSQAGTPHLAICREREGDDVTVSITQSCKPSPGQSIKLPYHMPIIIGWLDAKGKPIQPTVEGKAIWVADGALLELTEATQTFRFKNVPEGSVPSLLRGFSAPVTMAHDLSEDELAFLVAHDVDAFSRWEAVQDLYIQMILNNVEGEEHGDPFPLPKNISDTFGKLVADEKSDPALTAELLAVPNEIAIGLRQEILTPQDIHSAREAAVLALAERHRDAILAKYQGLEEAEYSQEQEAKARRRLRNTLLGFVVCLPEGEELAKRHYMTANNMTDRIAALTAISHSEFGCRDEILQEFYEAWKSDDLVVDKWFAVQAQSKRADTVSRIQKLVNHEAFSYKNPNRLRSLVSTFSMLNQTAFHSVGGAGYRFLAEMIVKVDEINPQTAARLVAPLGRWRRLDGPARDEMKASLAYILERKGLSDDVRELVEKSLA
ncbi:MAG: aminopeptidase N [Alphaproteobacteria bacterium]|nr:aminopeptidase N [Alphaproteobacteria bacterium]